MAYNLFLKSLVLCILLSARPGCLGLEILGLEIPLDLGIPSGYGIPNYLLTLLANAAVQFDMLFSPKIWTLTDQTEAEYDFIIVGSGSAGSVIANRLSEITQWKILLLECGIPETGIMGVPILAPVFQFTTYNWRYFMEYQQGYFFGLNNDRMPWPRGKALGGTTTINYMIYTRGNQWDYDRWAADGNPGWSYDDVLPYFIKSERANNLQNANPQVHGTNGYLSVENVHRSRLTDAVIEAGPYVGLNEFDYNDMVTPYGVAQIQGTIEEGKRHSVASAFLYPVQGRPNLDIVTKAYVTKVLINPQTKKAYGVRYDRNGRTYTVLAKKEVILSAGTLLTPQLLMLAGIGPRNHLQQLGIPVLKDLPVGRSLQDHLCFLGISFEIDKPYDINIPSLIAETPRYLLNRTGQLTALGGVEGIGYIKTTVADYPEEYPDMELLFGGGSLALDWGLATYRSFNIKDRVFDSVFRPLISGHSWQAIPMHIHPKSTGYLELRSTNPYDPPKFYGNYFTDPDGYDLEAFLEAVRFVQRIAKTPPFQRIGTKLNPRPMYTCAHLVFDSDDYWRCCIKSISVTLHHQVGTAKMGPANDTTAVVNENLQVHGIQNLRVADCSVIPKAIGAHTNAPSVMVGEKASDIIKSYYGEPI